MPVSEIAPGQTGECLTVFEGEAIEPFPFVVKDVMPNFLGPKQDLVLVRLQGEKAEFTGVVAGMSGSPCSIGGRLVGALSYAFANFAKEPIAGVTPMQGMLDVMKLPPETLPWRKDGPPTASRSRGESDAEWEAMHQGKALANARPVASADLAPIATPLSLGGVYRSIREHFTPWLKSQGFLPIAGSGGSKGTGPAALEPGSAVAAVLVQGDVDIAATGTVTSVEGNEVLAFGHPFLGVGPISAPMATARIHNTMASAMRSFKMSGTGKTVGEFTEDRLTAIGGYLGRSAKMVPVKGTLKTPGLDRAFQFEIARDAGLSPRFLAIGLANSLTGRYDVGTRGTVRIAGTVKASGFDPITVRNLYSSPRDGNLMVYGAIEMARTFATMWETPFGAPPEFEIALEAEVDPEPHEEYVESLHLGRGIARPGDPLEVAVRLRKNDGPVSIERFMLVVPHAWAGQQVDIVATGVDGAEQAEHVIGGDPRPRTLGQIAQWLRKRRSDGYIYLLAIRNGPGLSSDVDVMPFMPGTAVAVLSGSREKQARTRGVAWEERRARPGVVFGGVTSSLKVLAY
jgi:hypothetical protein